ncbi:cytochrome P450 72A397 [Beta vulgaris subsp. vulgaris]|uniref:cytochrome P450 72A397 n=1 Tax=Beta vulgaris subsp. vulgaris TaxID=3555 RepID=UPI00203707A8|nr:cytochrome P450 72A397 [Beta vulgaris subsp. vulgaris]
MGTIVALLATSFVLLLVSFSWRLLNWLWLKPKHLEMQLRKQGFSGNRYRLLYGDMKESSKMAKEAISSPIEISDDIVPRVQPFTHQIVKNFGKNSFVWFGPVPCVNIMEPQMIKEVLMRYEEFQKPNINPILKMFVKGLVVYEGQKWAKHRKILNPAFHMEKLKDLLGKFYVSCDDMISKWEDMVSTTGSCELDVWPCLDNLSSDVISRAAFGSSYEEGKKIFKLQKEQSTMAMKLIQQVYIPGLRFLPTKTNKRMKEINKEMRVLMNNIITKRENQMKMGETCNDDLLGILLESSLKEAREQGYRKNAGLTIEEIVEECKLFYLAGRDTTSVLLVWLMVRLGKHLDWQARAREEVLRVFGQNKPDYNGLNNLKIVTMIINEVLRLYPPVILMYRMIHKPTKIGDILLPPGVQISVPTMLVHNDPKLWGEDATEFNPERFSEGIAKATNSQVIYTPFGWGPRICIGQNFAMLEVKMALAMILQRYSFELSPSYSHAPFLVMNLQPQHGVPMILRKI